MSVREDRNHRLRKARAISDTHFSIPQNGKPVGYQFRDGLVGYEVHGISPGETVEVVLTFPEPVPSGSKVYMADSRGFYEIPAVVQDNSVTLTLTDGGIGDADGQANGVIDDPVGVAVPGASGGGSIDVTTSAPGGGGCSAAGAGNGAGEAAGSWALLVLAWLGLVLLRKRTEDGGR